MGTKETCLISFPVVIQVKKRTLALLLDPRHAHGGIEWLFLMERQRNKESSSLTTLLPISARSWMSEEDGN